MQQRTIKVWDLPLRLFHWMLAICVIGALVSVQVGGNAMIWHGRFGQLVVALLAFRIVWGFIGPTHARFTSFIRGPRAIFAALRGRWRGVGHNPLGALSVLAMIGLIGFQAVSGLFSNDDIMFNGPLYRAVSSSTSNQISGLHRQAEWFIYALLALHIMAILVHTFIKRDDIVTPMVTGRKKVDEAIAEPTRGGGWIALMVAVALAVAAWWVASGAWLPAPPPPPPDLGW